RDETVVVEPGGGERNGSSGRLELRREVVLGPGDESDPLVPEVDEALRRHLARCALVNADRRHVEQLYGAVHEYEPGALLRKLCVVGVIAAEIRHLRRDEDHPLDATVEEHV